MLNVMSSLISFLLIVTIISSNGVESSSEGKSQMYTFIFYGRVLVVTLKLIKRLIIGS